MKETMSGMYRMLAADPTGPYGEFDVLFKDGKFYIQNFDTMVEAKEIGVVNKTGDVEGTVTFEIPDWKKDPKIWNHDKMFGVYKDSKGE